LKVVDVHTHMLSHAYLALLKKHGGGYKVKKVVGGQTGIFKDGAPFMTLMPGMFDYEVRLQAMDQAGVDIAIVTLTSPNVYWGSPRVSLGTARLINDDMAEQQRRYPQRIRFMCSLPWQHAKLAVTELKRACDDLGAVGVMVMASIDGESLTDKRFAPIWKEIDRRGLPVLVHPSAPPGTKHLDVMKYNLIASVGFMFDTTLAITRMIFEGFFDQYPNLKIIASHGGGTLPYLVGRFEKGDEVEIPSRRQMKRKPTDYLRHIYYDSITYNLGALKYLISVVGPDHVMFGTDWPHQVHDTKGAFANTAALSKAECDAIRSANARSVFKL
jgi:aminocarboxymuconate-semialdehyde decarboxylase